MATTLTTNKIPPGVIIPENIMRAARTQAALEGISPEEWVNLNFVYNPNAEAEAEEYRRKFLAKTIVPGALQAALDKVPNCPPDPGDEL